LSGETSRALSISPSIPATASAFSSHHVPDRFRRNIERIERIERSSADGSARERRQR